MGAGAPIVFSILPGEAGARLDHLVAARLGCSHAAARRLIDAGGARVDGRQARSGARIAAATRIEITATPPSPAALRPAPEPDLPLSILHLDRRLIAVDKPAGIPSHPLAANERGTLANRLLARFPECGEVADDPREGGLAHRLDGATSGVLVAARDRAAWLTLRQSFRDGRVAKEYLALVAGEVAAPGEVTLPLAHDPRDPRRVIAVADPARAARLDARAATTRYSPLVSGDGMTLLRVTMASGRMHQVRAHLAAIGHPLFGDTLYGGPAAPPHQGHLLHAARIDLPHPDGPRLTIVAPLPAAAATLLSRLGLLPATQR